MPKSVKRTMRRRKPIQRRSRDTVNAVLEAVIRLLKRRGSSAITTNRIAVAAGVSIGSVYQYFPDKQAIFIALHERHIEEVDRVLADKIALSAGRPLEWLIAHVLDGMVEVHASDPELSALLDAEVPTRPDEARDFSLRVHTTLRDALAAHSDSLGGRAKLNLRAFLLANMLEAFGHAVVLRRPASLSQRSARIEACKAILAALQS